jgi:hypothetical protein
VVVGELHVEIAVARHVLLLRLDPEPAAVDAPL